MSHFPKYLVAFMDDHSRFIVGYGLHASQSAEHGVGLAGKKSCRPRLTHDES
jgi:hypothetical protein